VHRAVKRKGVGDERKERTGEEERREGRKEEGEEMESRGRVCKYQKRNKWSK